MTTSVHLFDDLSRAETKTTSNVNSDGSVVLDAVCQCYIYITRCVMAAIVYWNIIVFSLFPNQKSLI